MKFTPNSSRAGAEIPERLRCVWMTAGTLSNQSCDRQFNCEQCPLDRAMRMHFGGSAGQADSRSGDLLATGYCYSRNHCWIRKETDNIVRIGLEPIFVSLLPTIRTIVLPSLHESVTRGQTAFWVIIDGETLSFASPIDGFVSSRNTRVLGEPGTVCRHPITEGWLLEINTNDENSHRFMQPDEAKTAFVDDLWKFNESVSTLIGQKQPQVGFTLTDGGEYHLTVWTMVGAKRYCELLTKIFLGIDR